jgi:hypothetical protein
MSDTDEQRIKRINVAVNAEMLQAIDLVIDREGVTLTEAVRRLISYGDFIYRAARLDDAELLVRRGDTLKEIVVL